MGCGKRVDSRLELYNNVSLYSLIDICLQLLYLRLDERLDCHSQDLHGLPA